MSFKLLTLLLVSISYIPHLSAQKEYIDEVLEIIETHSIKRDSTDFGEIRKEAYAKLDGVTSIEDCYPIVRFILSSLNDNHSFLMEKEQVDRWKSTSTLNAESPPFAGKLLNNEVGYIRMDGFSSGDAISIQKYGSELQNLIKSIDSKNSKGWIIDLRQNVGGNCWPMLLGLGPLLGDGICGYFINNDEVKSGWYYRDGEVGVDSEPICRLNGIPYQLLNQESPIAVLTGPSTASSGEVIVTSFRGKRNSRSFGEGTAGLSTGNSDYLLSDGSMILLTTSIYADRNGNAYGGKIQPDVLVYSDIGKTDVEDESIVKQAIKWISESR